MLMLLLNANGCLGTRSVSLHDCHRIVSATYSRAIGSRRTPEYVGAGADTPPAAPPEVSPMIRYWVQPFFPLRFVTWSPLVRLASQCRFVFIPRRRGRSI